MKTSRRRFINLAAQASAVAVAAPHLVTASKGAEKNPIIGEGAHRYEVIHNWPQLPSQYSWQITHNVAVDRNGLVYVIHEGGVQHTGARREVIEIRHGDAVEKVSDVAGRRAAHIEIR